MNCAVGGQAVHQDVPLLDELSTVWPRTLVYHSADVYSACIARTEGRVAESAELIGVGRSTAYRAIERAAALYAYATARARDVVCIAHVTNTMATLGDDFEKGRGNGVPAALTRQGSPQDRTKRACLPLRYCVLAHDSLSCP